VSVRTSDVGRPRDDSLTGVARRVGAWATVAVALWLVPMLAVQIGALLERRAINPFGPRALVQTLARLVEHAGHEPWWQALPDPAAAPHHPGTLVVGLVVALAAYAAAAAWAWTRVLERSGQRALDERRRHELDGARWARRRDIADLLVDADELGDRVVLGTPRSPRGRAGRLVAVEAGHSCLVVAPTGQGKTESVIAPAVLDWQGPVLCASIKSDVYEQTAGHRSTLGETRVLDPSGVTDPTRVRHAHWTPLGAARSWRAARALADQMAGVGRKGAQATGTDDYFSNAAGELLGGLFFTAAWSSVPTMSTVMEWLASPEPAMDTITTQLQVMEHDSTLPPDVRHNAPHAHNAIRLRMIGQDPRTPEAVRTTAGNAIRAWLDWRLASAAPDDPGVLGPEWLWSQAGRWEQPGEQRTLYVLGPDGEQATYQGLFVGAISQIYDAYARASLEGRAPPRRLLIVLDEVANMAPVPTLDTWVTSARGLGINLVLAAQNLAQLDTVWGREKAETIASGPRVRMFGPGLADPQTLTHIERLGGHTAVLQDQVSRSPYLLGLQTSRSTLAHWRPIVSQQIARELPTHSGLVFYSNRPPFTVHWRSRHSHAELAAKTRLPPRPPSSEEIEFLTSVLEHGPLDDRDPPRPPGTDIDAISRDPEESW
jgi:type IV secretion system protein VirD4